MGRKSIPPSGTENLIEQALEAVAQCNTTGHPVTVHLNGGVGDHLEALSLLLPWAERHLRWNGDGCGATELIEPPLPQVDGIRSIKSPEKETAVIPVMALRAVVRALSPLITNHGCHKSNQAKEKKTVALLLACRGSW